MMTKRRKKVTRKEERREEIGNKRCEHQIYTLLQAIVSDHVSWHRFYLVSATAFKLIRHTGGF